MSYTEQINALQPPDHYDTAETFGYEQAQHAAAKIAAEADARIREAEIKEAAAWDMAAEVEKDVERLEGELATARAAEAAALKRVIDAEAERDRAKARMEESLALMQDVY